MNVVLDNSLQGYSVPVQSRGVVKFRPLCAYIEVFESLDGGIYLAPVQMQNGKMTLVQKPSDMLEVKASGKSLDVLLVEGSLVFGNKSDAKGIKYNGSYEDLFGNKFVVPRDSLGF